MDKPVVKVLVGDSSAGAFKELKNPRFNPFRYLPLALKVIEVGSGTHISLCIILSLPFLMQRLPSYFSQELTPSIRNPAAGIGGYGGIFFDLLFSVLFILSVSWVTERITFNRSVSTGGALRHAITKLPVAMVVSLVEMLGIIILSLPWVILPPSLLLVKIGAIPGLVYMCMHLALVTPAVSLRDCGVGAIGYASSILKKRYLKTLLHLLALGLIAISAVLGIVLIVSSYAGPTNFVAYVVVQEFVSPIFRYVAIVMATLMFLHLDHEQE